MRCLERKTLYSFEDKLWCLSCVLAYTGELEDDLREHIERLRGRVADGC